jgi:hypothetical protein
MAKAPTFQQASNYKMPFGPFVDIALDNIAKTENGLRYLDNMRGKMRPCDLLDNITRYLTEPVIEKDLIDMVATQSERYETR